MNIRPLPGAFRYFVSDCGTVLCENYRASGKLGKLAKIKHSLGYLRASILWDSGKRQSVGIHQLVALCFIPNPDGLPEVDHIDGDKQNNHVTNLRWCTHHQNLAWARERLGNWTKDADHKTTAVIGRDAFGNELRFPSIKAAAEHYGANYSTFAPMLCRAIKHTWWCKDRLWIRAA